MAKKKQAGSRARQIKRSKGHIGLGVKIYGGQKVSSGMVIVRQRGTKFYPGKNAAIGKDYTIFSKIEGIVTYRTRDHRQYIDITPQV